jgi:hypothetical protein
MKGMKFMHVNFFFLRFKSHFLAKNFLLGSGPSQFEKLDPDPDKSRPDPQRCL